MSHSNQLNPHVKRDNAGLVKIETGGHSSNTKVTVDGVVIQAIKAVITIEPRDANRIEITTISAQRRVGDEDPKENTQVFFGISKENYEFFRGLMEHVSGIPDGSLDHATRPDAGGSASIFNMLRFIQEARKSKT